MRRRRRRVLRGLLAARADRRARPREPILRRAGTPARPPGDRAGLFDRREPGANARDCVVVSSNWCVTRPPGRVATGQ